LEMKAILLLTIGVVVMAGASVCLGTQHFMPDEIAEVMFGTSDLPAPHQTIITQIRWPRTVLALLVGGALGLAGVLMQGLFRNPLADPGIVGVSAGGALGAVFSIFVGWGASMLILPFASLAGSFACASLAFVLSVRGGRSAIVSLLLAGLAINSLAGAGTSLMLVTSSQFLLRDALSWMMGTLDSRTWSHVAVAAPFVAAGALGALFVVRPLDLLAQGEEAAASMGVPVARVRLIVLLLSCLTAGAAVSVCGIIGFVGLIVPHIMRSVLGPSHGRLAIASFLGGGLLLLIADVATRTIPGGSNVRLGIVTSLIGVPFFLYLLRSSSRKENYA
jgi:iron complex transport system permease protein